MNNDLISTMTERIVRDFHPVQIILFGSHALGEAHPQSDVDLLVVFSELADKRTTAVDVRTARICRAQVILKSTITAQKGGFT